LPDIEILSDAVRAMRIATQKTGNANNLLRMPVLP